MSFIQQPAYIITILLLLVVFSEWLATKKYFKQAGAVILVILLAAILANLNIIPSSHNAPPLYDSIFKYAAPLGIFFLLLEVKLKDLRLAGLPMLMMFFLGSIATMIGVVLSYWLISPQHHHINQAYAVAGMYTGTYIGGSANLNAIAINYGVTKDGTLFAAINAADNIITTPWMLVTILLPPIMQKLFPRRKSIPPGMQMLTEQELKELVSGSNSGINLKDISLLLALGFGTLFISSLISNYFPKIPAILVLTTIALVLAQIPFIQKLRGGKMMGMLLIMLFLAVIGAFCDIQALVHSGEAAGILLLWVTAIVLIHGIIIFTIGGLFKQDWDIVSIASNANIGGATSAPVCAASLGRTDLQLPGLLAGSVGNAIGTYLGIFIAELLK
jgi:uncharacterized membrane protein